MHQVIRHLAGEFRELAFAQAFVVAETLVPRLWAANQDECIAESAPSHGTPLLLLFATDTYLSATRPSRQGRNESAAAVRPATRRCEYAGGATSRCCRRAR